MNLLAQWFFDGDYHDRMNNYNTTPYTNISFTNSGYVNQAVRFTGNNDSMLVASYIPLSGTDFTLDAWLYITNLRMDKNIHGLFGICSEYSSFRCLHIILRQVSSKYVLSLNFFNSDCEGVTALTVNTWIHAAFVFDSATLTQKVYLNGMLENSCQATSAINLTTTTNTTIGNIPLISGSPDYVPYQVSKMFFH